MKIIVTIFAAFTSCLVLPAQSGVQFQHLSTYNGLSYIGVNRMCVDKKGNLWVATGNGLNMFNGKTVEKYYAEDHPQLHNNSVVQVVCDPKNRIWALTTGGYVTLIDEKREMRRVAMYEDGNQARVLWILHTEKYGALLYTAKGNYFLRENISLPVSDSLTAGHFTFLPIRDWEKHNMKGRNSSFHFSEDFYLLIHEDAFLAVRYSTNTAEKKYNIAGCVPLANWGHDELLFYDRLSEEIKTVNLVTEEIKWPFKNVRDQRGRPVLAEFKQALRIDDNRYILGTANDGVYMYNKATGAMYNYRHEITDPASICNNTTTTMAVGKSGWVFVACNPNGISYFNSSDFIGTQSVFVDKNGNGYDGFIAGIATRDNNTYYIGTKSGLLEWKRNTNSSEFFEFFGKDGKPILKNKELVSIQFDSYGRIWVSVQNDGLVIIGSDRKLLKHIRYEEGNPRGLKQKNISRMKPAPDGYMWVSGRNGICRVDMKTFEIDNFENTPLQQFDSSLVSPLYLDQNSMWFSASMRGVFRYDFATKQLTEHPGFSKYKSEGVYDVHTDREGNLYVGNSRGMRIFYKDGREKLFTQKDGLLINRAEGLLLDGHNRMWIGNDIGLACYNPADSSLRVFDERYGLSIYGFRVGAYFQTANGEFIFGTPKGVQYFHPDSLYDKKIALNVQVNKIETRKIISQITDNREFRLAAADNQVTFHFGSVDFSPHVRTFYEYKLEPLDKNWVRVTDQNSVHYNSLPSGKYVFKVRISNDNKTWRQGSNEVTLFIATPFHQAWWFKTLGILAALFLIWMVIKYFRNKQVSQREQLETELVVNYFASQINSHNNVDALLWDVAKNCISRLNFEDCVIYLVDEARGVLVQKAAWGPKMERDFTIYQPIEIPLGKGIVGTVANTGKPELVSNTSLDPRYIADDAMRYSEIAVPLVNDGKVIGVIDSEHSRKNFFNKKHLNILSTVAVLCANQIERVRAEQEKQQAKIEVLENKQKVTESRLQSLRLQMNPHFLFNALNSIQQMILANEEMVATRYLSRFSKLLRTILVHSDREMISLREELDILNLYVELEAVRFKDSFRYSITCDRDIDADEVKVPTLLIQPFVENAIWHGLMHKEGERKLDIRFSEEEDYLRCIIEDNGVGREQSAARHLATGRDKQHTSKGISVSVERLRALSNGHGHEELLKIIDLKDGSGQPAGTRVEISFPILN